MKRSSYRDLDYAFGQAMLALRSALGLTQTGLADFLGVSRRAVGDWEAGSSYPKAEHLRKLIELGVRERAFPPAGQEQAIRALWQAAHQKLALDEAWLAALLTNDGSSLLPMTVALAQPTPSIQPKAAEPSARVNLPAQPTPFFGRRAELAEIARLLSDPACRLLTLFGPGGAGKTRLGLEVAARQSDAYADGVAFVALAPVSTPGQIVSAIGDALDLSFAGQTDPAAHLLSYLSHRHILLVLDNFEHLIAGADVVYDILERAPQVTILITTRERLNLRAEWLFDVEGLTYPLETGAPKTLAELADYSAVQLFAQRAIQVQPGFAVSEAALASIVRICQQVVGMPLAIELAAAGVRTLPVAEIERQIRSNLDVLATSLRDVPLRHRSMRAVFDHSWDLLTEPERALLSRLSVFRGGCTTSAAEQVAGATLIGLIGLVDKSLLRQTSIQSANAFAEARFALLEPIREYGLEKLAARGEAESILRAHARYYLALAETAAAQWDSAGADLAVEQLDRENDNLRAVLQWARDGGDLTSGLQLGAALTRFWRSRVHLNEGRAWLKDLLAREQPNTDSAATSTRVRAMQGAAWLASDQHDFADAARLFEQSMDLSGTSQEPEGSINLLLNSGLHARAVGQYARAKSLLEAALARHRAQGDRSSVSAGGLGFSLYYTALVLRELGEFGQAAALLDECVELHRWLGDREGMSQGLLGLSDVARDQGDATQLRKYCESALVIFREFGTLWAVGFTLNNLAQAALLDGDVKAALALADESAALFRGQQSDASLAEVLLTLGHIRRVEGQFSAAYDAFSEALRLAWVVGPRLIVPVALEGLAEVTALLGEAASAARLFGAASALRLQMGAPVRPVDLPALEIGLASARLSLGAESFGAIWNAAREEPLERILSTLWGYLPPTQTQPIEPERGLARPAATTGTRTDWNDAITVPAFYGREWEVRLLTEWALQEGCRVVSVLGLGGIGKSTLVVNLMHRVADQFEVVIWRSLRDTPSCDALLADLLQVLAPQAPRQIPDSLEGRQSLLLETMRASRVLMVFDNLESILDGGENAGRMRPGYEGFGRFLRLSAEAEHQSCVLLTSREKADELVPLEGTHAPVRTLRLARLDVEACDQLLAEKGVSGSPSERARLIEAYAGNPLALKIVAQSIVDLFDGEVTPFLEQDELIFGGVRELLAEQFDRLSTLEQRLLLWLAILRESATFDELMAAQVRPPPRARVLEAMEALRRRSLIERGQKQGSFTLQSMVLEYLTGRLIAEVAEEIEQGQLSRLSELGLAQASGFEYIREIQERVIVAPVLQRLHATYLRQSYVEERLIGLLRSLASRVGYAPDYAPANLATLLRIERGDLRGVDLSGLPLRGVYLQGVPMQDAWLAGTTVRDSAFSETFDSLTAIAISRDGTYWAAGSRRGEIRVWGAGGVTLHRVWRAHADLVCAVAFSPDGRTLASTGSWDGAVKLWDVASGMLLWSSQQPHQSYNLAFSPDGRLLASSQYSDTLYLWDMKSPTPVGTLRHPHFVAGVKWSPDGRWIATGDQQGQIRLWDVDQPEMAAAILMPEGHANNVEGLDFSPDGRILASGSWDNTVKLWDVESRQLLRTLTAHTHRVTASVVWSPDGRTLATSGRDQTIWLWDSETGNYRAALRGHHGTIYGLAFTPQSQTLVSVSEDGTLRVWDSASGQCLRVMQGYGTSFYDVDWSPDGSRLVTAGSDGVVTVFDASGQTSPQLLRGHQGFVVSVGWSSNGRWIASNEWNNAICIWDSTSGECLQVLHHDDEAGDYFDSLAWHPGGERFAIGTYTSGAQLFDVAGSGSRWESGRFPVWIRHVVWSPDGSRLAGGGADGSIYVWDGATGMLLYRLAGHRTSVLCVAWSPDGTRLASGSMGEGSGELFIWDMASGERVQSLVGHPTMVYAVAWGQTGDLLISGSGDGTLRWWDVASGACVRVHDAHQGVVHALRRSPDGVRLASCGSDAVIRLWDMRSHDLLQTLRRDRPYERLDVSGIQGLTEAQKATLRALGAVERVQPG